MVSAKSDGVTPGFVIEDEQRNRYMLKLDSPDYPELASAADIIGSKFFYALGYNTPENYIVRFHRRKLVVSDGAFWRDSSGVKRPITQTRARRLAEASADRARRQLPRAGQPLDRRQTAWAVHFTKERGRTTPTIPSRTRTGECCAGCVSSQPG